MASKIKTGFSTLREGVLDTRRAAKRKASLKCKVVIIDDKLRGDTYDGILTPDERLMLSTKTKHAAIQPTVFDIDGVKTVFLPRDFHGTLDWEMLKGVSKAVARKAFFAFKHGNQIARCILSTSSTIDWTYFNNPVSRSFSVDTGQVIQWKGLSLLDETPNWKMLTAWALGLFIGWLTMGMLAFLALMVIVMFG